MKLNIDDKDITPPFSKKDIDELATRMNLNFLEKEYTKDDLLKGMNIELEHSLLTKGDASDTALIALDHLNEDPKYYDKLSIMESSAEELSDEDFFNKIENEIKNAYSDKAALVSLISFANKADKFNSFDVADSLDFLICKKANSIVDKIREKINILRERRSDKVNEMIPSENEEIAIKKVNPGIVVKDVFGKYTLYTKNTEIDEKVRKSHLSIDDITKAILAKLAQFGKKEEVANIEKADFVKKYTVARTMATQTGLLI